MSTTSESKQGNSSNRSQSDSNPGLQDALSQAQQLISDLGPRFSSSFQKLEDLKQQLKDERFYLAVLGQFKRGKSTLINALLGHPLLPMSILPLTSIPTFLRYDQYLHAKVYFQDEGPPQVLDGEKAASGLTDFLAQYVTEESNPHNRLGVSHVEVFHSSSLLQDGVIVIDTPGIGSTFRHNTEMTLNLLPQCDAALFIVSSDPPITAVEVEFLKEVKSRVARLFFVLNKVDHLNEDEREIALHFLKTTLQEQVGMPYQEPLILSVSSRQGLEAKTLEDWALWASSGLQALENHLLGFLASEKHLALQEAIAQKTVDILDDALMRIQLVRSSLEMPISKLEARLMLFQMKVKEAGSQLVSSQDLLEGDKKRTVALLETLAENLRHAAHSHLRFIIRESLEKAGDGWTEELATHVLAEAIPVFFEHHMGTLVHTVEEKLKELLRLHEERVNGLIESIRQAASELFEIPYHPLTRREGFQEIRQPYWVTRKWSCSLSLLPEGFLDRFLPGALRRSRILRRLSQHVESLTAQNVEDIRWPLFQHLNETFYRFGATLRERLEETIVSLHGAIRAAQDKRLDNESSTAEEIQTLELTATRLEVIQSRLKTFRPAATGAGQ